MPDLSICIPTYNRLQYLKDLLPGVLDQVERVLRGTVEVVVSDNGSTDGTGAYLALLNHPRLRFWTNERNIGGDRNFLKCIREARGKFVWLIGDDDIVLEGALERAMQLVANGNVDLVISELGGGTSDKQYESYRDFLLDRCVRSAAPALAHTLISANIFRREVFDLDFAEAMLYTQYAHMFGLVKNLDGAVTVTSGLVAERPVRAVFAKYPSCLCVKQALYMRYLAKRFGIPRFAWYGFKMACNLPIEYLSRFKNLLIGRAGAP